MRQSFMSMGVIQRLAYASLLTALLLSIVLLVI